MSHFGWSLRLGEYRFHLFIYLFIYILRKLDLLRLLTESGIEFQLDTLILGKDAFLWQRNIALLIIADDSDVFYRF